MKLLFFTVVMMSCVCWGSAVAADFMRPLGISTSVVSPDDDYQMWCGGSPYLDTRPHHDVMMKFARPGDVMPGKDE